MFLLLIIIIGIEEATLVEYLLHLHDINFPVTVALAQLMANEILNKKFTNLPQPLQLGKGWMDQFMKRHTALSTAFANRIDRVRVDSVSMDVLENHFAKVSSIQ